MHILDPKQDNYIGDINWSNESGNINVRNMKQN